MLRRQGRDALVHYVRLIIAGWLLIDLGFLLGAWWASRHRLRDLDAAYAAGYAQGIVEICPD